MFIHLTLVPFLGHAGELKTKPTQHSVQELRRIGIQPDMVVCRSEEALDRDIRSKIALFANLPVDRVVSARDVDSIYKVPLYFRAEGVDDEVLSHFGLETEPPDLSDWEALVKRYDSRRHAGPDRHGRQVHPAERRLPLRHRGAPPRRRAPRREGRDQVGRLGAARAAVARGRARGARRHPRARRVRRARRGGEDPRGAVRARARRPVPRHLPRHAGRRGRVRAPRGGHGRRQLDRVRPRDAVPGDRPPARAEGGPRHGRHDAPGRRPGEAPRRTPARARSTARRSSTSATATATR